MVRLKWTAVVLDTPYIYCEGRLKVLRNLLHRAQFVEIHTSFLSAQHQSKNGRKHRTFGKASNEYSR